MEKRQMRRRFVVAKLLPLICIFLSVSLPSRDSLVTSFVLRGQHSLAQLGDVLGDLQEDDNDEFIDQLSPLDIRRLSDQADDRSMSGYDEDLDEADDELVDQNDDAGSEAVLTEQMMDAIGDDRDEDDEDSNVDNYNNESNVKERQPEAGKTALNKSQLHEIFDLVQTDENLNDDDQSPKAAKFDKKAQLSKNEVVQLFEQDVNENAADGHQSESASLRPLVIVTVSNASSPSTSETTERIVVVPTVKVTTIEELVKSVGQNSDDKKEEEVTLDVKEERFIPGTNDKTAKEWMIELTQPEEDATEVEATSDWMTKSAGSRSSKKFKRSANLESTSEKVAKSRAVQLLTTYIQLQEDENRHLTEALNLATRGQTERTDRYIDDEVEQLKLAVGNEQAIHRIRQVIRTEEDNEDADDDQDEAEAEAEDEIDDDVIDDVDDDDDDGDTVDDEDPVMFGMKRSDRGQLGGDDDDDLEVKEPPVLTFSDAGEDDEPELEEEDSDDEALLRERLRQFVIQKELDDMQRTAEQEQEQEDNNADNPMDVVWTPSSYQTNDQGSARAFNPFTRDIIELYRHGAVPFDKRQDASSRVYEQPKTAYYGVLPTDLEELIRARQEAADVATLENILQLNSIDSTIDDDELLTETGPDVCPAILDLTDNCLVARERGLVLDDEALQLCNRHQLCYSCGNEYGMTPEVCDRGYLSEADLLCTEAASGSPDPAHRRSRCKAEAAGLYVVMLDGHRSPSNAGYPVPPLCRQRCAYNFIVGSPGPRLLATKH